MKQEVLKNDDIEAKEILLVLDGQRPQKMETEKALALAQKKHLDLVVVKNGDNPICKLMDYKKFIYDQTKKEKEQKKKQKQNLQEVKEIRISSNIDINDLNTKAKQANKFISKNKKVKISLTLKGRENKDIAMNTINNFIALLENYTFSAEPKLEGRIISFVVAPKK